MVDCKGVHIKYSTNYAECVLIGTVCSMIAKTYLCVASKNATYPQVVVRTKKKKLVGTRAPVPTVDAVGGKIRIIKL